MAVAADAAIAHVKYVATDELMIFEWHKMLSSRRHHDYDNRATQTVHRA
jgi:hypothetical protein